MRPAAGIPATSVSTISPWPKRYSPSVPGTAVTSPSSTAVSSAASTLSRSSADARSSAGRLNVRPMIAASSRVCRAAMLSGSRRRRIVSRTPSGSGSSPGGSSRRPSASSSARISRVKNGLPSVTAWTASVRLGGGGVPLASAMSSPTLSRVSPARTSRRPARPMFASATCAPGAGRGVRSCIVTTSSTAASRSIRETKSSARSEPSSTACRSSMSTTTGASALRARRSATSASKSEKRAISEFSAPAAASAGR